MDSMNWSLHLRDCQICKKAIKGKFPGGPDAQSAKCCATGAPLCKAFHKYLDGIKKDTENRKNKKVGIVP